MRSLTPSRGGTPLRTTLDMLSLAITREQRAQHVDAGPMPSRYGTKNPAGTAHRPAAGTGSTPLGQRRSRLLVAALAFASAIAGALAGCHPTGTPIVDPLETAVLAAAVTVIVSRSSRGTWLVVGVGVVLLSRGWLLLPTVATIGLGFTSVFPRRSHRRLGALVGALGFQVMLRWPPELFHGFPTLVAAALLLLCAVSAYRRSGSRIQRRVRLTLAGLAVAAVVLCLPFAIGALLVRGDVSQGQHATRVAIDDLSGGSSG